MTITIIRFLGLWLFAAMIYLLNRTMSPNEYEESRQMVEDMIAAGEVDLEEVRPEFVRGMLLLDMLLRTTLVTTLCLVLWNIFM